MGRTAKPLSEQQALQLTTGTKLVKAGVYIRATDKAWLARPTIAGKRTWITIAPAKGRDGVSLSRAIRLLPERVAEHINTRKEKPGHKPTGLAMPFEMAAEKCIDAREAGWRNGKSRSQWESSLSKYAYPVIGRVPVGELTTSDVLEVVQPIWSSNNETASRLRQRIFRVIAYARTVAEEPGFNPAQWDGHLDNILPARKAVREVQPVQHMPAAEWRDFPDIYLQLSQRNGMTHKLMMFQALCGSRPGETRKAQWGDIDLVHGVWVIRRGTEKVAQGQIIPLSEQAVDILESIKGSGKPKKRDYIFPSQDGGPLSENAPSTAIKKMGLTGDITAHGSRSSFRDWGAAHHYSDDMLERALAHTAGAVKRAYQRDKLVEERRPLMQAWADYATGTQRAANVVAINE